jgi:hypothetical protein
MSRTSRRWAPALLASLALVVGMVSAAPAASAAPIGTLAPTPTSGNFFTQILGKAKVGKVVKAFRGTWSPASSYAYTFVWKRGAAVVKKGATATSYKLTKNDKKKITMTVVVKRAGCAPASATSAAVKVK